MRHKGFTLIESLVALAIVALSLNMAVSSSREFRNRQVFSAYSTTLMDALQFTRTQALVSSKAVSLCASADGETCGSHDYATGWIVFSEDPETANSQRGAHEHILAVQNALPRPWRLRTRNFNKYIRFLPNGRAYKSGRFMLCSLKTPQHKAAIIINSNGLVRWGNPGDAHDCLG